MTGHWNAIHAAQLNQRTVLGRLKTPLGKVVTIEGEIMDGDETGRKINTGTYMLRVEKADGRMLTPPVEIRFSADPELKLATDHFERYEHVHGKKTGSLAGYEIEKLDEGYVGRKVQLSGHETGRFYGTPDYPTDDYPLVAMPGYHFSTYFVVLDKALNN